MTIHVPIIIDTNIIFSSLLSPISRMSRILLDTDYQFFICEYVIIEIFKNKEKIIKRSQLSDKEIIEFYYMLLKRINLYKETLINLDTWNDAYTLCHDIDENDTPHIALTLELKGLLWTGDKKLKEGLSKKGFTQFFEQSS